MASIVSPSSAINVSPAGAGSGSLSAATAAGSPGVGLASAAGTTPKRLNEAALREASLLQPPPAVAFGAAAGFDETLGENGEGHARVGGLAGSSAAGAAGSASAVDEMDAAQGTQQREGSSDVAYLRDHNVHVLLDRLVKEVLVEKPADSSTWMLRWFREQHRLQCEERYRQNSPQHHPNHSDSMNDLPEHDAGQEMAPLPPQAIPYYQD